MKEITISSVTALSDLAATVLKDNEMSVGPLILTLQGNLGAGKTAFTKALGGVLGVTEDITSPTFVLMRSYATRHPKWKTLVHIDAYRFEEVKEATVLRLPELFTQEDSIVVIEWPERIAELLPPHTYTLQFAINEDESRVVTYGKNE